jgi:DNA-binding PadR family transcriptional regulator
MYEHRILLGFIRVHILHHATVDNGVYGLEMIKELKTHGYSISPGTLYPIFHEMKKDGVIQQKKLVVNGKVRKVYKATKKGERTLDNLKKFITELSEEVI